HFDRCIANLETLLGLYVDVLQHDINHRRLGQADDDAGPVAIDRLHVLDPDVVEVRRQTLHRLSRYRTLGHHLRVVLADQDRRTNVVHGDVLEAEVRDIVSAVAIGLDANPLVGSLEADALRMNALHAAGDFAAD